MTPLRQISPLALLLCAALVASLASSPAAATNTVQPQWAFLAETPTGDPVAMPRAGQTLYLKGLFAARSTTGSDVQVVWQISRETPSSREVLCGDNTAYAPVDWGLTCGPITIGSGIQEIVLSVGLAPGVPTDPVQFTSTSFAFDTGDLTCDPVAAALGTTVSVSGSICVAAHRDEPWNHGFPGANYFSFTLAQPTVVRLNAPNPRSLSSVPLVLLEGTNRGGRVVPPFATNEWNLPAGRYVIEAPSSSVVGDNYNIGLEESTRGLYLFFSGDGGGTIRSEPSGIDCRADCSHAFATFSRVHLTAEPDPGSVFAGWSGDCPDGDLVIQPGESHYECSVQFEKAPSGSSCILDDHTLCLNGGRFAVSAHFDAGGGNAGTAHVVQLTPDTGYLWFFASSNVEAVVKVLDGCALGGHYWVFAGGLTNVNLVMTVTDTKTGATRSYTNPQNTKFQPIQDTAAFSSCPAANKAVSTGGAGLAAVEAAVKKTAETMRNLIDSSSLPPSLSTLKGLASASTCAASSTALCLSGGRFQVTAHFDAGSGNSGTAHVVQLTPDTGYLWFFTSSNVEAVVKVLDGCALGGHYWVFAGGLTNVNLIVTVTDTRTGQSKTYTNPQGKAYQPIQDTSAFATCSSTTPPPPSGSAFEITSVSSGLSLNPHVAADPNGNFIAGWVVDSDATAAARVRARLFDTSGAALTNEIEIDSAVADFPLIDVAAGTNGFLALWEALPDPAGKIFIQRFNLAGQPEESPACIGFLDCGPKNAMGSPVIAVDDATKAYFAWSEKAGTFLRTYDPVTKLFGARELVQAATDDVYHGIAVDPAGRGLLVWRNGDWDIEAVPFAFGAVGDPLGSALVVNTKTAGHQDRPSVACARNGRCLVTWQDTTPSDSEFVDSVIKGQVVDRTGAKIGSEFQISPSSSAAYPQKAGTRQYDARVASLTDGTFVVAWRVADYGLMSIHVRDTGQVQGQVTVVSATSDPLGWCDVAALPGGGYVVVWDTVKPGAHPVAKLWGRILAQ